MNDQEKNMSGKKIVDALQEAVRCNDAISAVYQVVERYPKYALTQMNDHLAGEIVQAVMDALSGDGVGNSQVSGGAS
jgi:hypothetical protein